MSLTPRSKKEDDPKMIGLWKIGRTIGKGSCGRVRIARHSKTGQYAAVKIVSKTNIMTSRMSLRSLGDEADRILHSIEREIVVMKLIEHPNIMRLTTPAPQSEALGFFQQIITAVHYCHRFNIAHRDLKPENLLLDHNKNIRSSTSGWPLAGQGRSPPTSCGALTTPPRRCHGAHYNGASADTWSCGVILYALLAGRLPFDDDDLTTLLEKVKNGKFQAPKDIDPRASDLISKMLTKDIMQHPFYTSQPPKKMDCDVPNLDEIAAPLSSKDDIDSDLFSNLRSLWHGRPDEEIIASLLSKEPSWEKGVYHLLVRYRTNHMENYDEDEEKLLAKRRGRSELLASLPPRTGPPTPSRAAREGLPQASPSPSRGLSQMRQLSFLTSSLALNNMATSSTPRKQQPSSVSAATPTSALLSPLPATPASPAVHHGNVMQDERIQQFMLQVAEHLSVMQPGGAPPLDSVQSPRTTGAPPSTPYSMDPRSPGRNMQTPLGRRGMPSVDVFGAEGSAQSKTTQPLNVRPRSPAKSLTGVDKENVPRLTVNTRLGAQYMHSPARKSSAYGTDSGRRVQILEPPVIERGRLKKRRSPVPSPTSPASVAMSTGSSFVLSSTPRRAVQADAVPPPVIADAHRSVSVCRQLLEQMGVTSALAYEPSEDPSSPDSDTFTLKCWLEDSRDTRGAMSSLKGVRFRVEVHRPSSIQTMAGYAVLLNLVLEKGAATTLKLVYNRLRREWDLDSQPSAPASRSSVMEDDERFVEVVYAQ
ncbi:kinase-like domain-containing protein [Fomitopsis serialis]|uniref:kinase-like domain-containing protein n=1 Tax=Fomitopsis serialis TaxID=139415 RepID=UPI00200818AF|nr:kinase-like domain-containing protein [Neoantrodia serialis]KAH9924794.1 kinase-like domain-containing protein [Neoantrodia serialis]